MDIKVVFGFLMILAAVGAFVYSLRLDWKVKQSFNWTPTMGKIIRSEVVRETSYNNGNSNTVFVAKIEYEYTVNDRPYIGKKICVGGEFNTSFRARAEERTVKYPVGKEVAIFYNPKKPEDVCLERVREGRWFLNLIAAFFAIIGCAFILRA